LTLYDIEGRIVQKTNGILQKGENSISFDNVADLPPNIYFYKFESAQQNIYDKVIKM